MTLPPSSARWPFGACTPGLHLTVTTPLHGYVSIVDIDNMTVDHPYALLYRGFLFSNESLAVSFPGSQMCES